MRIGVVGGLGTIGKHIVSHFKKTCEVSIITRDNFFGQHPQYDSLIVSAADARKYLVNQNPVEDLRAVVELVQGLKKIRYSNLILISTVDVYNQVDNIGDEETPLFFKRPSYGDNRLFLEELVRHLTGGDALIVRLQGIIAENLKKNLLFDLKNLNQLNKINRNDVMQFYPISSLGQDLEICMNYKEKLINLSCEPLVVQDIVEMFTPTLLGQLLDLPARVNYNIQSKFNGNTRFWVDKNKSISAIGDYLYK